MGLEGFQSGRYVVRKVTAEPKPAAKTSGKPVNPETPNQRKPSSDAKPIAVEEKPTSVESVKAEEAKPAEKTEPGISEQMGSLFSKDASRIYDFYKTRTHQDDIRQNKLELDFSPVVANVESKSNYSPRDYHSSYQGLEVGARIWLTPLIGVSGHMSFSMAGRLGEAGGFNNTPTYYENMNLAGRFRTFFDSDLAARSVELNLHYVERKTQPSTDSTTRLRLKSQALGLGLQTRLPTSNSYAWTFGGIFYPRIQHTESALISGISSGTHEESVGLDLNLGGEWKLSRHSQILWGLEAQLEKNSFSGAVGAADPISGATVQNTSVDQTTYLLKLGYRWGH